MENQDYVRFTENSVKPKERYEFVENQDFISFLVATKKPNGGRPRLEYAPTLDKTSLLGLRTVLSGMSLWKIKTLFAFHKNETQRADGQIGVSVSNEYFVSVGMAKELAM